MNCPNCGAPTKANTCEYCKTEQAPKPAPRTVINTGGGAFIGHGGVATDFNDYAEALAEFNRLEAIEAKSYAQFAQGA